MAALTCVAVLGWGFALTRKAPQAKPGAKQDIPLRFWTNAELAAQLAPLKSIGIAIQTPSGWRVISGCRANFNPIRKRAVILCS